MRSAFERYKLLKLAMGEEKMPEEGNACDRWIEKSAVLYDLILQSVNNDTFQHIKDLVELDDSGQKAWKLLHDVIQPNTLPMVIVLKKELAALSMQPGDDVKPVLDKIKDTYARMAAAGSNVSQIQQCTKIISVLDNSWDNLIPTLNTQQDQWTPEWLRQQILQEDFRRHHTGGGAANKTAEGYGAAGGSRGRGGGRGRGRGRGFGRGRGRGDSTRGMGALVAGGALEWRVPAANEELVGLGNVLLVEGLSTNLLSVRRRQKSKAKVTFDPTSCRAKLGKLLLWDLEEKSSCIKDLWQLPIIPWNGKLTAAAAATARATAEGEKTAPTDGALDAVKKVQQPQQPHGEVLAGVDATAAWAKASSGSGEADWETWHERLCHVNFPMLQNLVKEWKQQQQQKLPTTPLIIEADEVQRPSRQVQVTVSDEEMFGVTEDGGEPEVEEQQQQQKQDAPPRAECLLDCPRRDVRPPNRLTYPIFGKPKVVRVLETKD
ncbi:unnamed protein product [Closterium sp. NIES-54]